VSFERNLVQCENSGELRIAREMAIDAVGGGRLSPGNSAESTSSLNWRRASVHASAMDSLPPPLAFFFHLFSEWVTDSGRR
jgi:hypothetical protein